jgi:hypothetical protein
MNKEKIMLWTMLDYFACSVGFRLRFRGRGGRQFGSSSAGGGSRRSDPAIGSRSQALSRVLISKNKKHTITGRLCAFRDFRKI